MEDSTREKGAKPVAFQREENGPWREMHEHPPFFALEFEDGWIWDSKNGWREPEYTTAPEKTPEEFQERRQGLKDMQQRIEKFEEFANQ